MHEDLRITKTQKAIHAAMHTLLENQNFRKITIRDICEEALISRATFYAHFNDKYDLLKHWLVRFRPSGMAQNDTYEIKEKKVNIFIYENKAVIRNLIMNAEDETLGILHDFLVFALELSEESNERSPRQIVQITFCVGGILNYFIWQVNNKFPSDVMPMNEHLYEVIQALKKTR